MSLGEGADLEGTEILLERYRQGDREALGTLVQRHIEAVERIVCVRTGSFLRSRRQVEDVLGEVLLEACKSIESYRPREDARFIDWLSKVAENKIRNLARKEQNDQPPGGLASLQGFRADPDGSSFALDVAAESTSVPDKLSRKEMCAILDECLREETVEEHREVILKREYAGGNWDWVAEEMGCPTPHAAEQLYQRAYKKLKERVRRRLGQPEADPDDEPRPSTRIQALSSITPQIGRSSSSADSSPPAPQPSP